MNYQLVKDLVDLVHKFELENGEANAYPKGINGFKMWLFNKDNENNANQPEPEWEGKEFGRSPESVIASLVVHMNRYAKNYFKSAIYHTEFSTQEEVIYLIVLKFSPPITKMELIKKNVHDKPAGMQIISRLLAKGWAQQRKSETDKRSKVLSLTPKGLEALENMFAKVRDATNIVSGKLTHAEKMELIHLLNKLNEFHHSIYEKNYDVAQLLENVMKEMNQ
jgi:DNA-binding MarR family transcriptional regulator